MKYNDAHLLCRTQHGLITWPQALRCGLSPDDVRGLLERGIWLRVSEGLYRSAGSPSTPHQALAAAVMACGAGAVASHRSAAWLWDLTDSAGTPEVTVTLSRAPRPKGVLVHRSTDLALATPSVRSGIVTTNPLRTIVDLGAVSPRQQLRDAVHRAVSRRLVTYAGLEAELSRVARRGRRGVGPLRVVLSERLDRDRPPSVLESRMDRVLKLAGIPLPRLERVVGPAGEYRCDYIWDEARLILEAKGYAAHGSPDATQADLVRELAIVEASGYQIISVGWTQVSHRPAALARQIRRIYLARRDLVEGRDATHG